MSFDVRRCFIQNDGKLLSRRAIVNKYNYSIIQKRKRLFVPFLRGLARFEQEDYQEAIADFNQALQQTPTPQEKTLATVYNDRGLAHFQLGNILFNSYA